MLGGREWEFKRAREALQKPGAELPNILLIRGSRVALLSPGLARTARKGNNCDGLLNGMNCPPTLGNRQLPHRKAFR